MYDNLDDIINTLRLIRTDGIGYVTFYSLMKLFGNATVAIDNLESNDLIRKVKKIVSRKIIQEELERLDLIGGRVIVYTDDLYPILLKGFKHSPPAITVIGNYKEVLFYKFRYVVAIVGSRNASLNALHLCRSISNKLAERNTLIISGLAHGIDTAAHSVVSLGYHTVAILGNGADIVYPKSNKRLYSEICDKSIVISEYPLGHKPLPSNFPRRNRTIAGMSQGVLVIEAKRSSGSMTTAKYALEHNRCVFAVPAFPNSCNSSGVNYLIKNGACLVEKADDILESLSSLSSCDLHEVKENKDFFSNSISKLSSTEKHELYDRILGLLSDMPVSIENIVRELQLPTKVVLMIIVELEILGYIQRNDSDECFLLIKA
ncbi:MAG: DNA protecting protein DprA [Candidatus Xenolissoclinum pacificiensis L6]|uniref:DNA protecting protein DprA n=1 Tax=Candidatus Xenolissoclinum pacificiensis L6 TaxID=1401685 RepID=W2V160_9RICK|nr:MAG: DNA protecting protein DprA [Candidatus Xenolissoclinum pacificiensis L6]